MSCLFFHVPSEASGPGQGTSGPRHALGSQVWVLAMQAPAAQGSAVIVPCWVLFPRLNKLLLEMSSFLLPFPFRTGIGSKETGWPP